MNTNLKNKNGFVLIYGIFLISLFLVGMLSLSVIQKKVLLEKQTLNFCHKYQTETFRLVLNPITKLFTLNSEARILKIKLKLAQIKLAAAIFAKNPVLAIKYTNEISKIKGKQLKLDQKQKFLYQQASILLKERNKDWEHQFKIFFSQISLKTKIAFATKIKEFKFFDSDLQIAPENAAEIAPVYVIKEPFSLNQTLQTNWVISLTADNRKWDPTLNLISKIQWEQHCGLTLNTKVENQWEIKTVVDKYSSNF